MLGNAARSGAVATDRGSLFQQAVNIFGSLTGFSPVVQDISVLAQIANKIFGELQGGPGRATNGTQTGPVEKPGVGVPTGTVATITITVTVQGSGQVTVKQSAQDAGAPSKEPQKTKTADKPPAGNTGEIAVPKQ
jgi:hypothetical protein